MKNKEEIEYANLLISRFTAFLNYDAQVIINFLKPNDEIDNLRVKKDAINLSIICIEEIYLTSDNRQKQFYHNVKEILQKMRYEIKSI